MHAPMCQGVGFAGVKLPEPDFWFRYFRRRGRFDASLPGTQVLMCEPALTQRLLTAVGTNPTASSTIQTISALCATVRIGATYWEVATECRCGRNVPVVTIEDVSSNTACDTWLAIVARRLPAQTYDLFGRSDGHPSYATSAGRACVRDRALLGCLMQG